VSTVQGNDKGHPVSCDRHRQVG